MNKKDRFSRIKAGDYASDTEFGLPGRPGNGDIFDSLSCSVAERSNEQGNPLRKLLKKLICGSTRTTKAPPQNREDIGHALFVHLAEGNRKAKGSENKVGRYGRSRTIVSKNIDSSRDQYKRDSQEGGYFSPLQRRYSHDELMSSHMEYIIEVQSTIEKLLAQEDTDGDFRITVADKGPKCFMLGSAGSNGYKKYEIRGTYNISNLLQELALASERNCNYIIVSQERLNENPLARLNRVIKDVFWKNLTRCIDEKGVVEMSKDSKFPDCPSIIYIPKDDSRAYNYYVSIANRHPNLKVYILPEVITPEYIRDLNEVPGMLSLKIKSIKDPKTGEEILKPCEFVVPGGRFNELYGWDSYFIVLGLLIDKYLDKAQGILENLCYEIQYYGKILNANRTYYLGRSQPPLLTDMIIKVTESLLDETDDIEPVFQLLYEGYRAAFKELLGVWLSSPRYVNSVGLSRYCAQGIGVPPETESTHFVHLLGPFAKKLGLSLEEFVKLYNDCEICDKQLDNYFLHDRAVRESGHDTTYRLENRCADLVTIDLNSLIYRYEMDLAAFAKNDPSGILKVHVKRGKGDVYLKSLNKFVNKLNNNPFEKVFLGEDPDFEWAAGICVENIEDDQVLVKTLSTAYSADGSFNPSTKEEGHLSVQRRGTFTVNQKDSEGNYTLVMSGFLSADEEHIVLMVYPEFFNRLALFTKTNVNKYLWNEEKGLFFDYNFKQGKQINYETVTSLWALWAQLASKEQADKMVPIALEKFETTGGLLPGTKESCDSLKMNKPSRQWDYPYGWAPHQVLAWAGLCRYGYEEDASRLAYRWMYSIAKSFFDFNGVVPEKFDIVKMTHKVNVEYGNVGSDFTYVVKEGFGWMNSSFKVGMYYLNKNMKLSLSVLTHPNELFGSSKELIVTTLQKEREP